MQLSRLDLGDNQIRYLPDDLVRLMNLTDLDLSINNINFLPAMFGEHLFSLKLLDLSYNYLADLPPSFSRLNKLLFLRVKENQMRSLGSYLKGMTSLLEIDASHNAVLSIAPEIEKCIELQSLLLNSNKLKKLPIELGFLLLLEKLDLQYNHLDSMLPEVGALKSLRDVNFSSNRIKGPVPIEFGMIEGLQHIDISFNAITSLPTSMGMLAQVEVINACEWSDLPIRHRASSASRGASSMRGPSWSTVQEGVVAGLGFRSRWGRTYNSRFKHADSFSTSLRSSLRVRPQPHRGSPGLDDGLRGSPEAQPQQQCSQALPRGALRHVGDGPGPQRQLHHPPTPQYPQDGG